MKHLILGLLCLFTMAANAQKISELPVATGKGQGTVVAVVQGTTTRQLPISNILSYSDSLKVVLDASIATKLATNGNGSALTGITQNQVAGLTVALGESYNSFDVSGNNVIFNKANSTKDTLEIAIPASVGSIRRLPGSTQVQAFISGVWVNQDFTDSVGAGGSGGSSTPSFYGDTLFFTTTDGNLNVARTIPVNGANGAESVDVDVWYQGTVNTGLGVVIGRMNANAFHAGTGNIIVSGTQYPRAPTYHGTTVTSADATIQSNGTDLMHLVVIGQGGLTINWKIWYTVKRHILAQ